jgi:hypothetical protein
MHERSITSWGCTNGDHRLRREEGCRAGHKAGGSTERGRAPKHATTSRLFSASSLRRRRRVDRHARSASSTSSLSPSAPRQAFARPCLQLHLPASAPASQYCRLSPSARSRSCTRYCPSLSGRPCAYVSLPDQVSHPVQAERFPTLCTHSLLSVLRTIEVFDAWRTFAASMLRALARASFFGADGMDEGEEGIRSGAAPVRCSHYSIRPLSSAPSVILTLFAYPKVRAFHHARVHSPHDSSVFREHVCALRAGAPFCAHRVRVTAAHGLPSLRLPSRPAPTLI